MNNIAIIGAGAMGSVYAALMADSGLNVFAIDRWAEHIEAEAASPPAVLSLVRGRQAPRQRTWRPDPDTFGGADGLVAAGRLSSQSRRYPN